MSFEDLRFTIDQIAPVYARVGTISRLWRLAGAISGTIRDDESGREYPIRPRSALGLQERNRSEIEGKKCVFALGRISPNAKSDNLIGWIIETSIEGAIGDYIQTRQQVMQQWPGDRLIQVVAGEKLRCLPEGIESIEWADDADLLACVQAYLNTSGDPLKHLLLWQIASQSHIRNVAQWVCVGGDEVLFNEHFFTLLHGCTPEEGAAIVDQAAPEHRPIIAEHLAYDRPLHQLASYKSYLKPQTLYRVFAQSALALDTESDGEALFQLGYARAGKAQMLFDQREDQVDQAKALDALEEHAQGRLVVGHNLIDWDLPVLRRMKKELVQNNPIWDTLLVSWLLNPAKHTHALTSSEKAHQADADALATYKLFGTQLQRLPRVVILKMAESGAGFKDILDAIKEKLDLVEDRYPQPLDYLGEHRQLVLPDWRLDECAWIPGVRYLWPKDPDDLLDFSLCPDKVSAYVPDDSEDIWARLVRLVIVDAARHSVQVRVRMLPYWVRSHVEDLIAHCRVPALAESVLRGEERWTIMSYRSVLPEYADSAKALFPLEGRLDLCRPHQSLVMGDVQSLEIAHLEQVGYKLLRVDQLGVLGDLGIGTVDKESDYWLECHPALARTYTAPWKLWQSRAGNHIEAEEIDEEEDLLFTWPRWREGYSQSVLEHDFVWPTSDNRAMYWKETIERFLSLQSPGEKKVYVLLIDQPEEGITVRKVLAGLGYTHLPPQESSTPLRALEWVVRHRSCHAVAILEEAHLWLEAGQVLKCRIQLVIEALPLSYWWMALPREEREALKGGLQSEGETEDEERQDDEVSQDDGEDYLLEDERVEPIEDEEAPQEKSQALVIETLVLDMAQVCIERFGRAWLKSLFRAKAIDDLPIVFDPRMNMVAGALRYRIQRQDIDFIPLSDGQGQIFDQYAEDFGQVERREAPLDYESYRQFFVKHWQKIRPDVQDFRPQTQKPAIEAIITNDADVLVRLPTGEGKSVIFQVPALLRGYHTRKLTLVITPLRALMRDQVTALWEMGFTQSVDYLSGDRDLWEVAEVHQGLVDNRIHLLYVAPERFRVPRFREALQRRYQNDRGLEYVVVDEAHCISQWGFEFRPDYLYALSEIQRLFRRPDREGFSHVLLFSATVTGAIQKDLQREIGTNGHSAFLLRPEDYTHPIQPHIQLESTDVGTDLYSDNIFSNRIELIRDLVLSADLDKSAVIVFVTRKRHAETLARMLEDDGRLPEHIRVRYFHAGLPAAERMEVYEELKNREVHVLVSTKAFGMGMDIPHIHWCVHLASPNYLEDYLQEVGRTGRDERARMEAGIDSVRCNLLYDVTDFHKNAELIHRNRIAPPDLVTLWQELTQRSQALAQGGQAICILPTDGSEALKGDQLRKALFWLERSERLSILRYLPDMLAVKLNQEVLTREAVADTDAGRIAHVLSQLYIASSDMSSGEGRGGESDWLGGALSLVRGFLGFLFAAKPQEEGQGQAAQQESAPVLKQRAEIKVGSVWQMAGLARLDDVYSALSRLQQSGALEIERQLTFRAGSYLPESKIMWSWLAEVLTLLIKPTSSLGAEYRPEELTNALFLGEEQANGWTPQRIRTAHRRCVRAAIRLCGVAQVRIRERLNEENEQVYQYTLSHREHRAVERRVRNIVRLAQKLEETLSKKTQINLSDLLLLDKRRVRMQDLRAALRLVSDLSLYNTEQALTPFSYVIALHKDEPLTAPVEGEEDTSIAESDRATFAQLAEVNRMTEYRAFAMELFATLPDGDMRKEFIDEYFAIENPDALFELIGRTAGRIESRELEERLEEILKRVRSEAMDGVMERMREGEEPRQYEVCAYPYDRNLLVNAGPGAGKTMVLMGRAAHLIQRQGLQPEQILILAFNRAVVHEIRSRIRDLFDQLGYGAYVRRLQVYTFHSFALKHMSRIGREERVEDNEGGIGEVLNTFVQKCAADPSFAQDVSRGIKAILVDEFQDMNDGLYAFLLSLQKASGAGLMAIGDDDQDILRWNRIGRDRVEAWTYFKRLEEDEELQPNVIDLSVNFRADEELVERSQNFIDQFLNGVSTRIKQDTRLRSRAETNQGILEPVSMPTIDHVTQTIGESIERNESYAILCRSNFEVCRLYEYVREEFPMVEVQGRENLQISRLRHVGVWCDICEARLAQDDNQRLTTTIREELDEVYRQTAIPEADCSDELEVDLSFIWDANRAENPQATLVDHLAFIDGLHLDDYIRMRGRTELPQWHREQAPIIISTIHKVKGLEFDTVSILSSQANFPFSRDDRSNLYAACADEARLYYVAMTRAKHRVFMKSGPREKAWSQGTESIPYRGEQRGMYLRGRFSDEVFISYPGFDQRMQDHISESVQVDDSLELASLNNGFYGFKHQGDLIGRFSRTASNNIRQYIQGSTPILRVHAVYRYLVDEQSVEQFPNIIQSCQKQGWLYTVLVSGIID